VKFGVVAENHGNKKELVEHELVRIDHLYGKVVVLLLDLNLKQSNISLIRKNVV
jgi:hypothetical protein